GAPPRTVPALHAPAVPAPAPLLQHARGQRPAAPARTPGQAPADACPAVQRAGAGWRSPVYPAVPGNPGADAQQLTPEHQPPAETVRTGRLGADPLQPDQHPRRSRPDPGRHRQPVGAHARVRITACPLRTGGGAPTKKPHSTPAPVGAPAPGANDCPPGSHRGGAPTRTSPGPVPCRSTRPGCEWLPARFAPGRCSYKKTSPNLRSPVGAPAPGAKGARVAPTPSTPPQTHPARAWH